MIELLLALLMANTPDLRSTAASDWVIVDDRVMGGVSQGAVQTSDGITRFHGQLSLENNGGFSSTRLLLGESLRGSTGLRMQVRGDGRRYQLRLRRGRDFDGVAWSVLFRTSDQWQTFEAPFSEFKPVFRGRPVPSAGDVEPSQIEQIGFLIGDKRAGKFWLEVKSIELIGAEYSD